MVAAVCGLDLVDHQVAALQGAVARARERVRVQATAPVVVEGQLTATHHDLADGRAPGLVVLGARLGHLLHAADRSLDQLGAPGQEGDLLGALDDT